MSKAEMVKTESNLLPHSAQGDTREMSWEGAVCPKGIRRDFSCHWVSFAFSLLFLSLCLFPCATRGEASSEILSPWQQGLA